MATLSLVMENATLALSGVGDSGRSLGSHPALPLQAFLRTTNVTIDVTHDVTDYVTHDVLPVEASQNMTGGGVPMTLHVTIGVIMLIVFLLGTLGNIFVIIVFGCFRSLRKPMNMLLINLAVADLLMAGCGSPMVALSSFHGHWVFGDVACQGYAFFMGQWGLVSIVTMAVIALERVCGVASYRLRSPLQRCGAPGTVLLIWCYSTVWVLPPLCGWGHYTRESYGTACSFTFLHPTWEDRWFLLYLVLGGFLVPCCIILVSYSLLWGWVLHNQRSFQRQAARMQTSLQLLRPNSCSNIELRVTKVCGLVVLVFLIAWLPYAVVTLVAAFGTEAHSRLVTPFVCMLPGIFAKMSSVYNPLLYTMSHLPFRKRLQRLLCHRSLCDSPNVQTQAHTPNMEGKSSTRRGTLRSGASLPYTTTFTSCRHKQGDEVRYSGSDSTGQVSLLKVPVVVEEDDSDTHGHIQTYSDSELIPTNGSYRNHGNIPTTETYSDSELIPTNGSYRNHGNIPSTETYSDSELIPTDGSYRNHGNIPSTETYSDSELIPTNGSYRNHGNIPSTETYSDSELIPTNGSYRNHGNIPSTETYSDSELIPTNGSYRNHGNIPSTEAYRNHGHTPISEGYTHSDSDLIPTSEADRDHGHIASTKTYSDDGHMAGTEQASQLIPEAQKLVREALDDL